MKRLLLGVALLSIAGPAFAQTQDNVDYSNQKMWDAVAEKDKENNTITIAHGAPFNSDEIIVTGNFIGYSNADDVTAPVSVLTQDDIESRNQAFISDILRTVPGLAVSQSGGGGSLTQLRLRGSEANHVLVIIDGVQVNNPTDGAFDFGGLRSEDVVKIEVLRGEQSAIYGSDAVGGVINIITRAGSNREQWRASVEYGSRETIEGQFSGVVPLGDATLSINGNAFQTEGFDISGLDGEKDGADTRRLSIGLNQVELGGLTLSGQASVNLRATDFDGDTDFDGRLNNTDSTTDVKTTTARLDGRFELAGFDHLLQVSTVETETDTQGGFSSLSIGSRDTASWAAKRTFNHDHDLTLFGEFERETYEFEGDPDVPSIDNYGLVADYKFNKDDLTITASARHDINDVFANATTWRLGAGYEFDWEGRLRGSIGTGVKNPTLIELFGFFPESRFTGNPALQPETSLGFSIGYEQELKDFEFAIDLFRSELKDEITTLFNADFTTTVVNLETDSTRQGLEIAAKWKPVDELYLGGSVSFLNSEENDVEEIRRPDFLAGFDATWVPIDTLYLTLTVDHTGSQIDTDFATFSNVELDAYTLVGANIKYELSDIVSIYVRGTNLLNEDYQDVVGFATAGRGLFTGLTANF
jgi:vitamin B12 transporter